MAWDYGYQQLSYDKYHRFVDEQLCSAFGIPARFFEPVKFDYKTEVKKEGSMIKYFVEWFVDGNWKEKFSDSSSSLSSAMSRMRDMVWSNGPEGMKWGIDGDGYLYRIVVKKPQWTSWRRSPLSTEWMEVSGCDSITEGTTKLSRDGFTVIWASVNDSNQCFGVDRHGNAFKIERTK